MTQRLHILFCTVLIIMLISACTSAPISGRNQLILVSASDEARLGLSEFQKLKQKTPVSQDAQTSAMLQRVGRRIAAVAPLANANWEFVLFEDKAANAFCLPGGKVGVYTGLLPVTLDEAGMATVVGHEVAHAVARHGAERISQGLLLEMGGQVLSVAMSKQPAQTQQIISSAYGIGGQVGYILPHSRTQELEADRLGLIYMARAGYDPRQSLAFWQRFSDYMGKKGGQPPVFLSTHPLDQTRINELKRHLPAAMAEYQRNQPR